MLKVENLAFSYASGKPILENVSFTLREHEILCLLGPNGTGKTTLMRCILGLNRASDGTVEVDGKNIFKMSGKQRANAMAFVPQATNMVFQYEGKEVVMMGRIANMTIGAKPKKRDTDIVEDVFKRLEIQHLKYKFFNRMSGGEKQMILVARALAQQSGIIIMDEPTASLDYSNQVKILQVVNDLASAGYSILMTSHFPDHAFLACNKVALLKGGHILNVGSPDEIVTTENLSSLYDTTVCVTNTHLDVTDEDMKVCVPVIMSDRKIYSNVCPCEEGESLRRMEESVKSTLERKGEFYEEN